ncbi:S-layer protein [Levilactobacillus brevis]|uniref:S-layer protein n=1 Tax=Levilactobacillus brevis TaxID=1580 RepID=UPI00155DF369|nr:S-layer protein [Levilactobacillus brevis]MCT3564835.1 S-layer protein [Levilactobacillus brevis]NRD28701.1 S-layer protein [Levilactobacillus brevis]
MFGGRKIMQSSLKKSLYLGLAALSFAGVAAVSTTASAKSYATAGAYSTLKTDATKRNVEATGTNALYTKPGTVKGAKVVASKATMAKLASSKKSADYFRAYGVKTTNRGSVYYKVVTMDGKYRGYVYGGKTTDAFAGGIKSADTTTTATNPTKLQNYYLKDVSKNTLWTAPKYTQYKASKVNLYGASKTDPFKVDSAATKTREGSLYYHVTDVNDSSISGWIYAGKGYDATATTQDLGGLSLTVSDAAATADNSVKVVYRDANKAQVGTATWITALTTTKSGDTVKTTDLNAAKQDLSAFVAAAKPANYKVATDYTAPTTTQYGSTLYVDVTATATSKINLNVDTVTPITNSDGTKTDVTSPLTKGTKLTSSDVTVKDFTSSVLDGTKGENIDATAIQTAIEGATLTGTKTYYDANGAAYHYTFKITKAGVFATDNRAATYGDTLNAYYTATLESGAASTTSSSDSWIA